MVAVVAAVAMTGVAAGRMRFGPMLGVLAAWSVLVLPVAFHWTLGGGWLAARGVFDYGAGAALTVCVGASALALAWVLGPRNGPHDAPSASHNRPLVLVGAGLAWVGWLGLVGGFAMSADGLAASAVLSAHLGAVGGGAGWMLLEKRLAGTVSSAGTVSGIIAGLVAVTPGAGFLDPFASFLVGLVAAVTVNLAVRLKYRIGYEDASDVVAIHLWSGAVGFLLVGVFGRVIIGDRTEGIGLIDGAGAGLLGEQALAVAAVGAYSFTATVVIARPGPIAAS